MKVECPYCKEKYNVKRKQLGMEATCAMCNSTFVLYVEGVPMYDNKSAKTVALWIAFFCFVLFFLIGGGGAYYYYLQSKKSPKTQEASVTKKSEKHAGATKKSERYAGAVNANADFASSSSKLKQIYICITMFRDDFNQRYPESFNELMKNHAQDTKLFIAPYDKKSTPASGKEIKPENTSYAYLGNGITSNYNGPIAFDKPWLLPDGWNKISVLYSDGSVKTVNINGVSEMSCRQVVETLMKDSKEQAVVEQLLKNADNEDKHK